MADPAYPAARAAAASIRAHLKQHEGGQLSAGQTQAPVPDTTTIEAVIDAAFWASLRREEERTPILSIAIVSPEHVTHPIRFERPLPLAPQALTRVAPAVERPGIHLGVWPSAAGDLSVWGATRNLPALCFVLEVIAPGLLVIKESPGEQSGKYVNIAVLQGDEIKVVDQRAATVPDCPDLLTSLLGLESQFAPAESVNVLIQLAVSMRRHGRGGSLLVVPAGTGAWLDSMVQPILYSIAPPFSAMSALMQADADAQSRRSWQDELRRAVDVIAGLTAVDGATVISDNYELLAFGTKIVRRRGSPVVNRVIVTEPIEGAEPLIVEPAQFGGTRHLSAAQFVHDHHDSIALVASQDGRFTVFAWSPCEDMVHAHRIETLLL